MAKYKYDAFISHASEDKASFVEPLANELKKFGLNIWYDKFSLKVGDNLLHSIEKGLIESKYGIVIFSPNFFSKNWTKSELEGLFSREMEGRKVILPVWHNISSKEMKAEYSMLASKVALRSSDGVTAVAKSLVELIKPKLLAVESAIELATSAQAHFVKQAKERHPGYDFTIHSGPPKPWEVSSVPGTLASTTKNNTRIDISVSDPSLIEFPPTINLTFIGDGARKAEEMYRTGKPQSWEPGEVINFKTAIPLMPKELSSNYKFEMKQDLSKIPSRHARIEVGNTDLAFPLMEIRPIRAGTNETELRISKKGIPLSINLVLSLDGSSEMSCTLNWEFTDCTYTQCQKFIQVLDALKEDALLRIIDIEMEQLILEIPSLSAMVKDLPVSKGSRYVTAIAAAAEKHFGVRILYGGEPSDSDWDTLHILDCLLNGKEYGTNLRATAHVKKVADDPAQFKAIEDGTISTFQEPENFPGYFELFGTKLPAQAWGLHTPQCVLKDSKASLKEFSQTKAGENFEVAFKGASPTFVRWKSEIPIAKPSE